MERADQKMPREESESTLPVIGSSGFISQSYVCKRWRRHTGSACLKEYSSNHVDRNCPVHSVSSLSLVAAVANDAKHPAATTVDLFVPRIASRSQFLS